jgi:hypothetical protein
MICQFCARAREVKFGRRVGVPDESGGWWNPGRAYWGLSVCLHAKTKNFFELVGMRCVMVCLEEFLCSARRMDVS